MSGEDGAEQVVDAQVVEEASTPQAVAVAPAPVPPPALAVAPQVKLADLVARLDAIKEAQKVAMVKDTDYGVIPGTDKPTLFKPGAEKLAALFQLDVQPSNEKRWEADDHLTVVSRVTIFHAPTGARLGSGEGICTTHERKYGKRNAKPKCPNCSEETIFRSKTQGEGWFCWKKKGGCGAQFAADDEKITAQEIGEVDNPDLPDLWNTIDKMATKRALVAAVLIVTGASAVFTQDVEDMGGERAESEEFHRTSAEAGNAGHQPARAQATRREGQGDGKSSQATAPQRRKIHALASELGLTEPQLKAWIEWSAGTPHTDRITKARASELIELLGSYEDIEAALADFNSALKADDEKAQKIAGKYSNGGEG